MRDPVREKQWHAEWRSRNREKERRRAARWRRKNRARVRAWEVANRHARKVSEHLGITIPEARAVIARDHEQRQARRGNAGVCSEELRY